MCATAILIQKESGGNLAEVLEKTCADDSGAVPVEAAGSGVHRTGTPDRDGFSRFCRWFSGSLLYLVNPETMSVLWTRPIGLKLLYAAAGMTVVGRTDHSQDRQHGSVKGNYGNCSLLVSSSCSC